MNVLYLDDVSAGARTGVVLRWVSEHAVGASHLHVNNAEVLHNMTPEGMGLVLLPLYIVQPDLTGGRLVHVPTNEHLPTDGLSVVYARWRNLAPSVRRFVDFLAEAFEHETFASSFIRDNASNELSVLGSGLSGPAALFTRRECELESAAGRTRQVRQECRLLAGA